MARNVIRVNGDLTRSFHGDLIYIQEEVDKVVIELRRQVSDRISPEVLDYRGYDEPPMRLYGVGERRLDPALHNYLRELPPLPLPQPQQQQQQQQQRLPRRTLDMLYQRWRARDDEG